MLCVHCSIAPGAGADLAIQDHRPGWVMFYATQAAACNGHLDAVLLLVELGCPWRLPKGSTPAIHHVPALIARSLPGTQVGAHERANAGRAAHDGQGTVLQRRCVSQHACCAHASGG